MAGQHTGDPTRSRMRLGQLPTRLRGRPPIVGKIFWGHRDNLASAQGNTNLIQGMPFAPRLGVQAQDEHGAWVSPRQVLAGLFHRWKRPLALERRNARIVVKLGYPLYYFSTIV